jgi:hypothetical protein
MNNNNNNGKHGKNCRIAMVTLLFAARFGASCTCLAFTTVYSPESMPIRSRVSGSGTLVLASSSSGSDDRFDFDFDFENVAAAVVVPGFLTGSNEFRPLCEALTAKGIPTVAVPMPNWHWLPCLGGRSARPILERIDFTVRHLVANLENTENGILSNKNNAIYNIPKYSYSWWDCWQDFQNNPGGALNVGGSSKVDEYPVVEPKGDFSLPENLRNDNNGSGGEPKKKIALIGHR